MFVNVSPHLRGEIPSSYGSTPLVQKLCKVAPLFSTTSTMLLQQPLSFQGFASLPVGGYTTIPEIGENPRPLRSCSQLSPHLDFLCFQQLPTVAIYNPFVFKSIQQWGGVAGGCSFSIFHFFLARHSFAPSRERPLAISSCPPTANAKLRTANHFASSLSAPAVRFP